MKKFRATVWPEEGMFVAQCLDIDIASQGETEELALEALKEAIQLHFAPPTATLLPKVETLEIELGAA